jgi:hypothetical protein
MLDASPETPAGPDAGSPRPVAVAPDPPPPAPARRGPGAVLLAFSNRLFLVFFFLQIFPYPIDALPSLEAVGTWHRQGLQALVLWIAKVTFGTAFDPSPTGSSDTPYRYLQAATLFVLAFVAALVWTIVRRGAPVKPRLEDPLRAYLRFGLGATLLVYGWGKVFPVQMSAPGPDRLLLPLGESSPMGMVWNFMGTSAAYQTFTGVGESLAGFLLLWRRTAVLGALLGAGVMANVVALNFCFDVPVKLSSSMYLLMLLFVLAPHAKRLAAIFLLHRPAALPELTPFPVRRTWLRRTLAAVYLAFAAWVTIEPALQAYRHLTTFGRLAKPGPLDGFYRVESFSRNGVLDRANEDAARWVRMGITKGRLGTIVRADGQPVRYYLAVVPKKKMLAFSSYTDPSAEPVLTYTEPQPGLLRLEGDFEGAKTIVLLRRQPDPGLLMTRGFHWINEVPLNR